MAQYFCEGKQHYRESRKHGFNVVGIEELGALHYCDECHEDHLARVEETKAEDRANNTDKRKTRYEHDSGTHRAC